MKKFVLTLLFFIFTAGILFAQDKILQAGVSVEDVPREFYGSWRVTAKLDDTNSYGLFKPQSVDMWTISRIGDKVTLTNPFSGASADVSIRTVEGNLIVFSKKAPYDNKLLTDTISIRLSDNTFSGINTLCLESYSLVDNHLMKTETARYLIKGEKISGESVLKD